MESFDDKFILKVYTGESDTFEGTSLYESIVRRARELHLAGATVIRGIMGFGASARIHSAKLLRLSEDLPVIIEVIDTRENIEKLLPFVREHVKEGLVTLEPIRALSLEADSTD